MVPINNSDTAWLIVADYNQENSKYHEELREDVLNPEINDWIHETKVEMFGLIYSGPITDYGEMVGSLFVFHSFAGSLVGTSRRVGCGHTTSRCIGGIAAVPSEV